MTEISEFSKIGLKAPPHSLEAERGVLGAILSDPTATPKAIELLKEEHFYKEAHKIIFSVIRGMFERQIEVDPISLTEELNKRKKLEAVGGAFYVSSLYSGTPTSTYIESHARIIKEKFIKRELIRIAGDIIKRAYDEASDGLEDVDMAESEIFRIAQQRYHKDYAPIKEISKRTMEHISALAERGREGLTGVDTGFVDLNDMTGGFQKSDFVVIAGRPAMGKTALGLTIARHAAINRKIPVAFFSIEMSSIQLAMRLISAESKVNMNKIRTGKLNQTDLTAIARAVGILAEAPIIIDDSPSLSILDLRAKARRLVAEYGIQMLMVDYLQLMKAPNAETREREISIISQSLKELAKEMNIPVIAMAQLNRGVEGRNDKRPVLSDLRESGSIEQDADVVLFIHRPEYYDKNKEELKGIAQIIIAKQRNGPVGEASVAYLKEYASFADLARQYEEPPPSEGDFADADYSEYDEEPF